MIETENNLKLPEILSESFFQKSLENGTHINNIQIYNIKISLASSVGENYTSTIYRVEIKYRQENKNAEQISLIVKYILLDAIKIELQEIEAFEKEVEMYTVIMPKIEKLYKCVGTFVPKCFNSLNQLPHQAIVLQDLKPFGYIVADRVERLDEAHSRIVLQKLGRYHAGTIVLLEQEPNIFETFNKGYFQASSYNMNSFQNIFVKSLVQFVQFVSSWEGCEKIAEKLKNVEKNFHQKVIDCFASKPNEIRVLNHSDLWTNNMMFKYENDKVCDVKFIDLQISTNGSPGYDINYFLNSSVKIDVLETKRDELLKSYYDSFRKGLEELNYLNIPPIEAILNEVRDKEFFGFMAAVGVAPVMLLDRVESADSTFETFTNNDALSKKRAVVYSSPKYQKHMKYCLKRFDELGIFD